MRAVFFFFFFFTETCAGLYLVTRLVFLFLRRSSVPHASREDVLALCRLGCLYRLPVADQLLCVPAWSGHQEARGEGLGDAS